ncbi:sterigmatocystin biosynthesis P450 monooxygenase stcS [Paramyrothecium foliicola]|nr:sterigmatocystin biosynthesis P450 monooxygenase stcS [Paramyrothecium foliicola]
MASEPEAQAQGAVNAVHSVPLEIWAAIASFADRPTLAALTSTNRALRSLLACKRFDHIYLVGTQEELYKVLPIFSSLVMSFLANQASVSELTSTSRTTIQIIPPQYRAGLDGSEFDGASPPPLPPCGARQQSWIENILPYSIFAAISAMPNLTTLDLGVPSIPDVFSADDLIILGNRQRFGAWPIRRLKISAPAELTIAIFRTCAQLEVVELMTDYPLSLLESLKEAQPHLQRLCLSFAEYWRFIRPQLENPPPLSQLVPCFQHLKWLFLYGFLWSFGTWNDIHDPPDTIYFLLGYWPVFALLAILAALPSIGIYLFHIWSFYGLDIKQFSHFPQPETDKKKGHWPWIEKAARAGTLGRSWNMVMYEQFEKLGSPPVLLIDWRPMLPAAVLFVFDNTVAEQITRPSKNYSTSLPKDPMMLQLAPLVGLRSLVTLDGEEWKGLRKRILPGFQPQHLLNLTGAILDKTELFIEHLERFAASGEELSMDELTTNLTFDVIGIVTFNLDLHAQIPGKQSPVLSTYRALQQAYVKKDRIKPWWLTYFTKNERDIRRLDKQLDTVLKETILEQHSKSSRDDENSARSVMELSLTGIDELTPDILQQASDTCRGFLFAGHDTTSILLQWTFYEITRRPSALQALKSELDDVFGPDPSPSAVITQLRSAENGQLMSRLKYTDAVIKETLRLHPPGTTARQVPKGSGVFLTLPDGQRLNVDGLILSPVALIIQRDRKVYGETADEFMPERWLSPEAANIPESSWRPYERGPRRCTGSELANMEVRIILACVARRFEFVKTGLGELELNEKGLPILDDKGYYKTKSTLYTTDQVTCKVVDGTKMKIRIRELGFAKA